MVTLELRVALHPGAIAGMFRGAPRADLSEEPERANCSFGFDAD